jgi:hypothetical protein
VCSNATTAVQCGPDLLSDSPVATCTNQACVSGACTGVCTPNAAQCTDDVHFELCQPDGIWSAPDAYTCPDACVDNQCQGVCVPSTTQSCTYFDPGTGMDEGGTETCGSNGQWGVCG